MTTALLLSKNLAYSVTIIAKHMPGDYDIEYTSPWAGANYLPSVMHLCSKGDTNAEAVILMKPTANGRETPGPSWLVWQTTCPKRVSIFRVGHLNWFSKIRF